MSAWLSRGRGRRGETDPASAFSATSDLAFRPWSEAALELRAVVAEDTAPALAQGSVDLTLHRGGLSVLVHPAALGLAEVAAGLARPAAGEVLWFGEPIAGLRPGALARRRRGRVGYLPAADPDVPVVIPHLTVLENLLLPAVATRSVPESLERADALLGRFGLAERARDRAGALDPAQQRSLALARVLLPAPTVVVAAEPDAATQAVLAERAANGLAVLVVRTAPMGG